MPLLSLNAADAAARLDAFDTVIDARSPAEFADDRLPRAENWPVLDDDERKAVGTEYKQVSAFDARKHGAAHVARRIADLLDAHLGNKPRTWQPLVYCWRGGKRSGTLAWFLSEVGFRAHVLDGGYKAFREHVRGALDGVPARLRFIVIAGRTGSGKTRLLQALAAQGAQVLDLEGLAQHRGSILGGLPDAPQPGQRRFEMQVWDVLRGFDPARPVFVESESRKIGRLAVPDALLTRMREHGRCVFVEMPDAARIDLLLDDYAFHRTDPEAFCRQLDGLVALRGRDVVTRWQAQARAGAWRDAYADLLHVHYDPLYLRSITRNFDLDHARRLDLRDGSATALGQAARDLLGLASD